MPRDVHLRQINDAYLDKLVEDIVRKQQIVQPQTSLLARARREAKLVAQKITHRASHKQE